MAELNSTSDLNLPHDDYEAGFRVGWAAVHGDSRPRPSLAPLAPRLTLLGFSKFTMGVRSGVEAALGVQDLDELESGEDAPPLL